MDEVRLVDETVLELTECRRFLCFLGLGLRDRRGATGPTGNRLLGSYRSIGIVGRLNALQVYLLHSLQLDICLRVAPSALADLAQLVIFIEVEVRALQVLVYVLTKHFLEISVGQLAALLLGA